MAASQPNNVSALVRHTPLSLVPQNHFFYIMTTLPTKSLESRVSDLEQRVQKLSTDIEDHISKERALVSRIKKRQGTWLLSPSRRPSPEEYSLPSLGGHPYDEASCAGKVGSASSIASSFDPTTSSTTSGCHSFSTKGSVQSC